MGESLQGMNKQFELRDEWNTIFYKPILDDKVRSHQKISLGCISRIKIFRSSGLQKNVLRFEKAILVTKYER